LEMRGQQQARCYSASMTRMFRLRDMMRNILRLLMEQAAADGVMDFLAGTPSSSERGSSSLASLTAVQP
jgi:hypothetical protein